MNENKKVVLTYEENEFEQEEFFHTWDEALQFVRDNEIDEYALDSPDDSVLVWVED